MALKPIPYTADGSGPAGAIPIAVEGVENPVKGAIPVEVHGLGEGGSASSVPFGLGAFIGNGVTLIVQSPREIPLSLTEEISEAIFSHGIGWDMTPFSSLSLIDLEYRSRVGEAPTGLPNNGSGITVTVPGNLLLDYQNDPDWSEFDVTFEDPDA